VRKIYLVLLLGGTLALGACTPANVEDLTGKIKQAQDYARLACGFVPSVETVANIFASGSKEVQTALAAATAICAAISKVSGRRGSVAKVAGVPVRGRFVGR
jgi:hypothetical protein